MNMQHKFHIWLLASLCVTSVCFAQVQQPSKMPRLVMLVSGSPETHKVRIDAFLEGLRALGYVEGKNIVIDYRYAQGKSDQFAQLAMDAVRSQPDVIFVGGTTLVTAAK